MYDLKYKCPIFKYNWYLIKRFSYLHHRLYKVHNLCRDYIVCNYTRIQKQEGNMRPCIYCPLSGASGEFGSKTMVPHKDSPKRTNTRLWGYFYVNWVKY